MRLSLPVALLLSVAGAPAHFEIPAGEISGKALTAKGAKLLVGADGTLSGTVGKGDGLTGTWEVRDGRFCRTITAPERLAGTACQTATIAGGTLTLTRDDGTSVAYSID
jgi:hypothetical protein